MIKRQQITAARGLLGWSRQELSDRCGVSLRTLARFESGEGDITSAKLARIEDALLEAGIGFVDGGVVLDSLKRDATGDGRKQDPASSGETATRPPKRR